MECVNVSNLRKVYNEGKMPVEALGGVDLSIGKGEFLALVGPSGSGKTTLLNLMGGLDRPTEGDIYVEGRKITALSGSELADIRLRRIGFVFQEYNLIQVLTAIENVEYVMLLQGIKEKERREKALSILKEVGLEGLEDRRPKELSGGQQQRVAVARAIVSEPAIILADEPTANLDSVTGAALLDLTGEIIDAQDVFWRHSLYRLYLSYSEEELNLTIGRQRIAWGQGRIWSPTDLFNAVSPLRIEAEQRQGVDAVNMEYSLGSLSSFNIVYAAADTSGEDSVGARLKTNISGYDISMMAGEFSEDMVIGFDFAGNIGDSGFRGEGTFTRQKDGEDFPRFVLSWDYNFANSLYLLLEYLYNGGNIGGSATPASISRSSGEIATRNRNFLATGLGYDITPLIRFDLYDIYDADGGGIFINPLTRYNVFTDLDWIVGAQVFSEGGDSEYSGFPNIYYTSIEWYF